MTDQPGFWTLPPAPPLEGPPLGGAGTPPASAPPLGPMKAAGAPTPTPPDAGRRRIVVFAALAAALALIAGGVGGALGVAAGRRSSPLPSVPATRPATVTQPTMPALTTPSTPSTGSAAPAPPLGAGGGAGLDVRAILAKIEPSVVDIQSQEGRGVGEGTGIVISNDGKILTNAHVVSGASRITVTAFKGKQALPARLLGADEAHDVAVLQVDASAGLPAADLGRSADVAVGDDVVAIGNALGLRGDPSVTRGIISGLNRSIGTHTGMIQTDAAINPGNSGGPLVNRAGQVIGINTAVATENGAQNIGFAIPIDQARSLTDGLAAGKAPAPTARLGVSMAPSDDGSPGAVVMAVSPGSAAADAGLAAGDRIVAVDGASVAGPDELGGLIRGHQPGDTVKLTIVRAGREMTVTARLGAQTGN